MLAFNGCITFITTVLGTFIILISLVRQTSQGFFDLLLYILLAYFGLNRLFQTGFATVVALMLVSGTAVVRTRSVVHIHTVLLDTVTFLFRIRIRFARFNRSSRLHRCTRFGIRIFRSFMESRLSGSVIVVELFAFIIAFFPSLFLCFLFRTSRLVQGIQVNFAGYLDIRLELRSVQTEQATVFRFSRSLTLCGRFIHFFRRACRRFRLHFNFRFFLFDSFFFHNYLFYFFFLHRLFNRSNLLFFLFCRGFYCLFFRSRSRNDNRLRFCNRLRFDFRLRLNDRLRFNDRLRLGYYRFFFHFRSLLNFFMLSVQVDTAFRYDFRLELFRDHGLYFRGLLFFHRSGLSLFLSVRTFYPRTFKTTLRQILSKLFYEQSILFITDPRVGICILLNRMTFLV